MSGCQNEDEMVITLFGNDDEEIHYLLDKPLHPIVRGGVQKEITFFSSLLLQRGLAPPAPPPLVVPWAINILGPYFNVAVDALGPETDFTLEKKQKK